MISHLVKAVPSLFRCTVSFILIVIGLACLGGSAHASSTVANSFGVNEHLQRYTDYQTDCDQLIASGTKWVRISPEWGSIETSRGVYNATYLAKLDDIVDRLTSKNVQILWVLAYTAPWASSQPASTTPSRYKPALWSDWENYVAFIVNRYNNKVTCWEVWNEEDNSGFWKDSVADYYTLLQKASVQIRAANSNNKVVMGGLALSSNSQDSYGLGTFFDTLLGLGAKDYFDIVNYHSYGDNARWYRLYQGMNDVIAKYGIQSKKIWITELGNSTGGNSAKEPVKADMVNRYQTTIAQWSNVERVMWYVYRNTTSGNAGEDNYGLVTSTLSVLPAYYSYQALGGAETNFWVQKNYSTQAATLLTLYYVPAVSGDGSRVVDYDTDGTIKRIPAGYYMYLRLNDAWFYDSNQGLDNNVAIDVTYLDTGTGSGVLHYDSTSSAYTGLSWARTNTGGWVTKTFTINNAKFANRQNNAADLRLYAGSGVDLVVSKVIVRKESKVARVILQTTPVFKYIDYILNTDPANEAYNPVATIGGVECRQISGNAKYSYFRVADGLARPGVTTLQVGITYWDDGTDRLLLQYNALSATYKNYYITKTNTQAWKYVQVTLTDANFSHTQNSTCDFRLSNGYDNSVEYIRSVDVTVP